MTLVNISDHFQMIWGDAQMLFQERYFNFKCLGNFAIHLGIYYYSFIHFLFTSILATFYVIFVGFGGQKKMVKFSKYWLCIFWEKITVMTLVNAGGHFFKWLKFMFCHFWPNKCHTPLVYALCMCLKSMLTLFARHIKTEIRSTKGDRTTIFNLRMWRLNLVTP